ncbi:MAG: thioredoxin family protein [Mariniphaga sp.]|jgi:thioredoxin 1|nr:thioredoxin family protein [Mariniphaga sp.]
MKTKLYRHLLIAFTIVLTLSVTVSAQTNAKGKNASAKEQNTKVENHKVTFIELGSVRCIPCQKMQPIMKSIEEKYAGQVKVVFHDVWTTEGKPYAQKYGIQSIPTQVFLDENGKEFSRHTGYFPEEELVKVLKTKGVKAPPKEGNKKNPISE